ncbi:type II 3-dehydroquinate dehydratase [Streptomyces sp. NBC_00448]|uniref:type II 3-dehydroquinate dehydratase n=1 Tax=Streptomyces sp. NBC_00448 TaxID=2903652 RepID=UPI002E212463
MSDPSGLRILVLNGPNLNLLAERDPSLYGQTTLKEIEQQVTSLGEELGVSVTCDQRNSEGEIVTLLQDSRTAYDGVVLNPGPLSHYSYALRDVVDVISTPVVEVHISNILAREAFRQTSVTSPAAQGVICGCGAFGYELALRAVLHRIAQNQAPAVR